MPIEQPLFRITGSGPWQTIRVLLFGHPLPILQIKGDLNESRVCNVDFLINLPD